MWTDPAAYRRNVADMINISAAKRRKRGRKAAKSQQPLNITWPRKWWEEDLSSLPPWEISEDKRSSFLKEFELDAGKKNVKIICDERDWHHIADELARYVIRRSDEKQSKTKDFTQLKRLERFKQDAGALLIETQNRYGFVYFWSWASIDFGDPISTLIMMLASYFRQKGLQPTASSLYREPKKGSAEPDPSLFNWVVRELNKLIPKELRLTRGTDEALRKRISDTLASHRYLD
jgi:hypothetical protein